MIPIVPPIRRYFGDYDAEKIPQTYPGTFSVLIDRDFRALVLGSGVLTDAPTVPIGPRKIPEGYDD